MLLAILCDFTAVTIGFVPNEYNVSENGGSITLMVGLINGVLERGVIVNFMTKPDTATSTGSLIEIPPPPPPPKKNCTSDFNVFFSSCRL